MLWSILHFASRIGGLRYIPLAYWYQLYMRFSHCMANPKKEHFREDVAQQGVKASLSVKDRNSFNLLIKTFEEFQFEFKWSFFG